MSKCAALVVGVVALAATPASADRFAVGVLTGLRQQSFHGTLQATPQATPMGDVTDAAPSLDVMAGVRLLPQLAIGARFGLSQVDVQRYWGHGSDYNDFDGYLRTPYDTSLFVQVEYGRAWLAPWFGVQSLHATDQARGESMFDGSSAARDLSDHWESSLSYGVTAGADVLVIHGNRVSLFSGAQGGTGGYSAVTFGVGYRR